jgi:uncharacterized protein
MDSLAKTLALPLHKVTAAVALLDAGNTLPFIARYRKEATDGLDEQDLRRLEVELKAQRALEERRAAILETIEGQGKLTPELRKQIEAALTRTALEDLYLPYKQKRSTRASQAREKGLEPLALLLLAQGRDTRQVEEEALQGARDIVAEMIAEHATVRARVRAKAMQFGQLKVVLAPKAEDPREVYRAYYDFNVSPGRIRPHQTLAIDRAEREKILRVNLTVPERDWQDAIWASFRLDRRSPWAPHLEQAAVDAANRLLLPAVERDVRRELTEQAARHAILNFQDNLRALLLTPPLAGHTVLGLDPGFRTGCKVAVVNPTGKLLETGVVYLHQARGAREQLLAWMRKFGVTLVSIGNGTASRESEALVADLLRELPKVRYLMTSEAGASVYSASPLARAELPELDVTLRGAVSIARRVQDPLAELVKIDPKALGVGMYQHDVDAGELETALDGVVESVVNRVGVDVNTASPALLTHVAGIGPKLADKIFAHREKSGPFADRKSLSAVAGLGAKTLLQAAGFLRVNGGKNPLDATAIHPESYPIAQKILKRGPIDQLRAQVEALAAELGTGVPTLTDILDQLVAPGRDPRLDAPAPFLRADLLKMEDLAPGMELTGTVRNVVDFGAFVDLGVKQDGLLHRSQLPRGQRLQVGDVIQVVIEEIDPRRGRISLNWP